MRNLFPRPLGLLLFAALPALGVLGCGDSQPQAEMPRVTVEYTRPLGTQGPWRLVGENDRLVFEQAETEAAASPTPRPTLVIATRVPEGDLEATLRPTLSLGRSFPRPVVVDVGVLPCEKQFRRMLIDYDGRVPFGPEVVSELSERLGELRPDCLDGGWAPEFGLGVQCLGVSVGGMRIGDGFIRWEGSIKKRAKVFSTRRDGGGDILVHFEKLPFLGEGGCWYYEVRSRSWGWVVVAPDGLYGGRDFPEFPLCEAYLKQVLWESWQKGGSGDLDARGVARGVARVRLDIPGECGTRLWSVFPKVGPQEGCLLEGPTGDLQGTALVVNWHDDFPASDGAVCWVLSVDDGEWVPFYGIEDR